MSTPPRITLAVLAYNQSATIDTAVGSALGQQCEPVEVLLSDDASPDDTFDKMQAAASVYTGPHQVVVRRNARNLGIGEHYNEVMRAARGRLIVMMAGDDISTPDRVARTAAAWDASGERLDLIASHLHDMGHGGEDFGILRVDDLADWKTLDDWARRRPYIVGASHAFTRRLFERFGPLGPQVAYEDQVNTLRALLMGDGGACTLDAPLVHYRRGGVSDRMRDFSGERFLQWTRRQNIKHLALHAQWLQDAAQAGCKAQVQAAIAKEYGHELFWQSLLAADTVRGRWQAVHAHPGLPLGWRLRKWAYLGLPGVAGRLRHWQSAWKHLRRGDAR